MNDEIKLAESMRLISVSGVVEGQRYRHYKGYTYTVVATGFDERTIEPVVVYRSSPSAYCWARPLEDFTWTVVVGGRIVPRFAREGV